MTERDDTRSDQADKALDADQLHTRSVSEIRAMRDGYRAEIERLSYARRILHGQLDIVAAELRRRDEHDTHGLIEQLTTILADGPSQNSPRNSDVYQPREDEVDSLEARLLETPLAEIPEMDDDRLRELSLSLREEEHRISDTRRIVMDNHDVTQAELVERYRTGETTVNDVLKSTSERGSSE